MKVMINLIHQPLMDALELNRKKWLFTPYRAATLTQLSLDEKKKYANLAALTHHSREEDKLKYAGGILMHLPVSGHMDITGHILSFLPYMDMKKAQTYLNFAQEKHPDGLVVAHVIAKNMIK